ncbi:hypothetical protein [Psychrobacter lutiphocae]|uniref:hypothetical protein n=1 Tax=Psychrobacter lutiphocae TaxID=540500 RepID=UPI0003785426|nr:hypothetical protein [Psychrobacter lutiphocae]
MTQSDYENDAQDLSEVEQQKDNAQDVVHQVNDALNDDVLNKDVEIQTAKMSFAPYKNDHQSMQIGELIFENQTDKVIVYGDIDIVKNKKGLAQALKLQQVVNAIVEELQQAKDAGELDEAVQNEVNVSQQTQTSKVVDNPFS